MGDRANVNPGGSDFTAAELRQIVTELEKHRGKANAMKRVDLLKKIGGKDRTLRAIFAYLACHPEEGVAPLNDHKGGVFAGATWLEIQTEADWYEANGKSSLDHAGHLRRNAARMAAAQPLLFGLMT